MAVTAHAYPQFMQRDLSGSAAVALGGSGDTLKVMLLSAYTYASTHATLADVLAAGTEAAGSGYTAGGQALTGVTLSTAAGVTSLSCANPSWSAATITAAYAVFYDAAGSTNATRYPFCYWDFGGSVSSSANTYTLTVNSALLTWTAS